MDPISLGVLGVAIWFGIEGGLYSVLYKASRNSYEKAYESDFMRALRRRKILTDDNKFHSLPLPFVPINPEFMTELCMITEGRKEDEPQPHIEKNLLRFKRKSWKLWRHPVEAKMMRCSSKYAIMDIGHASHVYLLKRGKYLKKNSEYPFHIVDIFYLTFNLSESRVDWLAEKFPDETHHQKELPTPEEMKKRQFPEEEETTSQLVESHFLDTLKRREILVDGGKFSLPPLPFLRIASKSTVARICEEFGKRNDDEPEPHVETNFLYFEWSGNTTSHPVEAEMMRCSSQYAFMDIGHTSTAYLLKLGQFKKSHNERPLFRIINTLDFNLKLSEPRLEWLNEKFPKETHHKQELPSRAKFYDSHFLNTLMRRKILRNDGSKFNLIPIPFLHIASESAVAEICEKYGKRKDDEPKPHIETNFIHFMRGGRWTKPVQAEMMRCSSQYAFMDIGHASTAYLLKLGEIHESRKGRPLFFIANVIYFNLELSKPRLNWLAEKFPEETHHERELPREEETSSHTPSDEEEGTHSDSAEKSGQKPPGP